MPEQRLGALSRLGVGWRRERAEGVEGGQVAVLGAIAPVHGEHVGVFEILEVAAYLLWPLWMIAMGITLAVRRDRPVRPETAVAAA
ncbi:hypothetical protein GCM10023176_35020 [Micromonospora coerulea]|uniref:Uncharacterized protein n=1 Tax=Micromonospora coerulea TaxID=47856 RepID=A0ABP8SN01_9ACTN